MTTGALDRRIADLAERQHGVFSRAQAQRLGATSHQVKHRLTTERWTRIAPNVYLLQGVPESWTQRLMTACLSWGTGSAISHAAAAAFRNLAGFNREVVELTVPAYRRGGMPVIVHRNLLESIDVEVIDQIPITTTARTLVDLAAVAPTGRVEEAFDDALRRGLVSIPRVRWRVEKLERNGRLGGLKVIRSILDSRASSGVPQSVFETRMLRLLKSSGLPRPVLQYQVTSGSRTIAFLDFAYPARLLAIETDGYRWHSGRIQWAHDRARDRELSLLGWRVIHVTWDELVEKPQDLVSAIRRFLSA